MAVFCAMVMARPATMSMDLPSALLVNVALCNRSQPAFKVMWPALLACALSVRSLVAPPVARNKSPVALMPERLAVPALTVRLPAVVTKWSWLLVPAVTRSCWLSAAVAVVLPVASTRLTERLRASTVRLSASVM